jgi:hypothetical protein
MATPLHSAPRTRIRPRPACPISTTAPTHLIFVTRPQPARRASRRIAIRARVTNRIEKVRGVIRPERWISLLESVSTGPWNARNGGGGGEFAVAVCFEADPHPARSRVAEATAIQPQ